MGDPTGGRRIANHATWDDWIARDAIVCSIDPPERFDAAVDQVVESLGGAVELLGLGEPTHGVEAFLILRNQVFKRLATKHGYSAIAIESSFPRGWMVNDYVAGQGEQGSLEWDAGFSHGFGKAAANRELVEWMRMYNADRVHHTKLHFYGFDSPTEMMSTDSPRRLLHFAVDYLASMDTLSGQARRQRIDELLGDDASWENPAASFDPTKAIGLTPAAASLRIETEELMSELQNRRPEFIAVSGAERYLDAVQNASSARQMLNYHAALARPSPNRLAELLGVRDAMMADHLVFITARERARGNGGGKVFAHAHNMHLQYGRAQWQMGQNTIAWWPAGSHVREILGPRYAVIGTGMGVSEAIGVGSPELGTLEQRLTESPGSCRFIPTHHGPAIPVAAIAAMPIRSTKNPGYFPFSPQSFTDFDWLAVLNSTAYNRDSPMKPAEEP